MALYYNINGGLHILIFAFFSKIFYCSYMKCNKIKVEDYDRALSKVNCTFINILQTK